MGGRELAVSEILTRFAALPGFQQKSLGQGVGKQRLGYVEKYLVPELLLAEAAQERKLGERPRVVAASKDALASTLTQALREGIEKDRPITDGEIEAFHQSHRDLFERPQAIRISRILVESEAKAKELIDKTARIAKVDDWKNLTREESVDQATRERGGDLGFVREDGKTDVPELEVDPALYRAASRVRDGERVAEPVPEGKRFAVVWRRGTRPLRRRSLTEETPQIREFLLQQRTEEALHSLIKELRARHLTSYHPELLDPLDFDAWTTEGLGVGPILVR